MDRKTFALTALFVCGILSHSGVCTSQTSPDDDADKSGSLCVLPNSPQLPKWISPSGEYNPDSLTLHIDRREAVRWPHKTPLLIDGLDLQARHLVVLTSDGKPVQSVHFKFSGYHDSRLCVSFDGYQGVQLGNRTDALWCKVKNRACWR